jgi:CRISPR-associated protein Cas2
VFYIVSYDIADDKRRSKVAKTLKDFGERVQKSVFECLLDKGNLQRMVKKLEKYVDENEDSIRVYQLCNECKQEIKIIGKGTVTEDEDVYIV